MRDNESFHSVEVVQLGLKLKSTLKNVKTTKGGKQKSRKSVTIVDPEQVPAETMSGE